MSGLWQSFMSGQTSLDTLNPVILRSWQRCREHNLNCQHVDMNELLAGQLLRERLDAHEELQKAGKDVLPFLVRYLKGREYIVLLCDEEGYIMKALGSPPFLNKAQKVHLSPGASWRENIKGTNAIGTALEEQQCVKVLGWEHYVRENHFLNCWAAPIRNGRGELAGVLDISGQADGADDRILEIVMMGAKMIEQNLQVLELQNDYQFCREGIKLAAGMLRDGFVTINSRGEITEINDAGVTLLGHSREDVLGRHAEDVFQARKRLNHNFRSVIDETGREIQSSFNNVQGENGEFLGAVGLMQPAEPGKKELSWVGRSELTRSLFRQAAKVAATLATVLIQGESGTGKEVVARYIHRMSPRDKGPFIALNCAAIPATLIESELFGYADGAFTGAKRGGQPGKFEQAQNGTIFFDEIGDMPLNVQASLLRVLQEREIYRIGDSKTRKVDVRVLAATNKDLKKLVDEGGFRLDLYYRLKVVTLNIPPLRERTEDILDLAPYFVLKACNNQGCRPLAISDELFSSLLSYAWPGNIRELENCVESMVAMAEGLELTKADLPAEIHCSTGLSEADEGDLLEQQTRQAILQALSKTNGKVAPAARILGIGRTTLYRKMEEYQIR
jgi:sigma-54 dependent transcriptional regulator, acetoin dehydrogenase operon transcriptional activator AcoR